MKPQKVINKKNISFMTKHGYRTPKYIWVCYDDLGDPCYEITKRDCEIKRKRSNQIIQRETEEGLK